MGRRLRAEVDVIAKRHRENVQDAAKLLGWVVVARREGVDAVEGFTKSLWTLRSLDTNSSIGEEAERFCVWRDAQCRDQC